MTPTFPNFAGKHAHGSIIEPEAVARMSKVAHPIPETAVLTYAGHLTRTVAARADVTVVDGLPAPLRRLHIVDGVGVATGFGIGAPAAAMVVEDLIARGCRRIVNIGLAGTIAPSCGIGDIVVCTEAIRDEGVSHHYLEPARAVAPSPGLTDLLGDALGAACQRGPTWTTDAPYRETAAEVRHYNAEGVLTVEMEAAAVFAVATHRRVDAAAAFVVSDSLASGTWDPRFDEPILRSGLERLLVAGLAIGAR